MRKEDAPTRTLSSVNSVQSAGTWGAKARRLAAGVSRQTKKAAQQRADDHSRGPYLVRRTGGERLIVVAGENLGDVTQRSIERQQRVCPKIRISRQSPVVAIFPDRRPSRKQRPHRAEMIAARAVLRGAGRNNPHSPIGFVFGLRHSSAIMAPALSSSSRPNHIGTVASTLGSSTF